MELYIDYREHKLIDELTKRNVEFMKDNLEIGDISIKLNGKTIYLLERKTLEDLASSIRDGRYKEQSFRLNDYSLHNHHICYLIEGQLSKYKVSKFSKNVINKKVIHSAMCSLSFYKGFSIFQTENMYDTADYIIHIFEKIKKENKCGCYSSAEEMSTSEEKIESTEEKQEEKKYTSCIKKLKKDYITPTNIHVVMLSTIPGVSDTIATIIMEKYKTISNLIFEYKQNDKILKEFTYIKNDKSKKLTKPVIKNLEEYLLQ
jgi:ERCC4-type nuclease